MTFKGPLQPTLFYVSMKLGENSSYVKLEGHPAPTQRDLSSTLEGK